MEKDKLISFLTGVYLVRKFIFVAVVLSASAALLFWRNATPQTPQLAQLTEQAAHIEVLNFDTENAVTSSAGTEVAPTVVNPSVVVVAAGESLWSIAERELGSGARYKELVQLNHIANTRALTVGTKLVLPHEVKTNSVTEKITPPAPEQQGHYTVQKGDCLWTIAAQNLGDPLRWQEIFALNRERIGSNPNLILPGTQLVLPPLTFATIDPVRK